MLFLGIVYSYSMFRLEIEAVYNVHSVSSAIPYMTVLFFYSLFMAIGGILYSRYNTLIIGISGVVFISLGFFLAAISHSIFTISLTYGVLVGTGIGLLYGLPLRVVSILGHKKVGILTGITLVGFGLSPLIFAPFIGKLLDSFGLSKTFIILAVGYLILTLPIVWTLSKHDTMPKIREKLSYPVLKNKQFYMVYFLFFIVTFIGLTYIGFTGNIGEELIGLKNVAFFISIFAIFNGVGRPLFGYINDKIGFKKASIISFISILFASLLHYFIPNNILVFTVTFIVFYLNFGGWLALAPSATISLFEKEDFSKNYGLMFTAYGVGAIFGNLSSGYIAEVFELRSVFLLMSVLAVIGIMTVYFSFIRKKVLL